jgi:hypothetical protein
MKIVTTKHFGLKFLLLIIFWVVPAVPCASSPEICVGGEELSVPIVYGRVVYSRKGNTEEAIPGATVQVSRVVGDELQYVGIATTDNAGYFHIKGIRPGKYNISASVSGFRTWSARLKVVKAPQTQKIEKQIVIGLQPFVPGACGNARVEMVKSK